MNNIKYRQYVGGKFHYWGYINHSENGKPEFTGPIKTLDGSFIESDQFTGLTDKNGVEIYEGDVVNAVLIDKSGTKNKYVGKVFYQEYEFCIETKTHCWPVASWHCVHECEVIGNIYQNPELLK